MFNISMRRSFVAFRKNSKFQKRFPKEEVKNHGRLYQIFSDRRKATVKRKIHFFPSARTFFRILFIFWWSINGFGFNTLFCCYCYRLVYRQLLCRRRRCLFRFRLSPESCSQADDVTLLSMMDAIFVAVSPVKIDR